MRKQCVKYSDCRHKKLGNGTLPGDGSCKLSSLQSLSKFSLTISIIMNTPEKIPFTPRRAKPGQHDRIRPHDKKDETEVGRIARPTVSSFFFSRLQLPSCFHDLLLHNLPLFFTSSAHRLSFRLPTIPPLHIRNQPLQTLRCVFPPHKHLNHAETFT